MGRQWVAESGAAKIALTYVLLSGAWVFMSDWWFGMVAGNLAQLTTVQTAKGLTFIGMSGLLVFGLVRREQRQLAETNEELERTLQHARVLHRCLRHNLRNSCDVIRNNVELLESDHGDGAENRDRIRRQATKLATIATKAQDLREVVFDDEVAHVEQDPATLVEEAIAAMRTSYPDATFAFESPTDQCVVAHPRLAVAIEELLANAVDHHETGSPRVTVRLTREGDDVVVTVRDDGPGLPPIERAVLEGGVEDALTHSRGIGLWVVRFIVTASGGSLTVPSSSSDGAVVALRLPAAGV